jgi:hypothetical protein
VLRAGGAGVEASVCSECGLGVTDLRSQIKIPRIRSEI